MVIAERIMHMPAVGFNRRLEHLKSEALTHLVKATGFRI